MTTGKLLALATALASVAAVSTFWAVSRAPAGPIPHMASGLVGLTTGQAARFNVVNVGETRGFVIEGCRFFDASGRLLAESGRQVLALDQAFSCQFDVPVETEGRHEVHAVVGLGGRSDDVVATLEVIDLDTGQSRMGWNNHNETLVREPETTAEPQESR